MAPPYACELNLLGVERDFRIDLQHALLSPKEVSHSLTEDCVLSARELCVWSSPVQSSMWLFAWSQPQDFQAHQSRAQAPKTRALNLLLCPSPQSQNQMQSQKLSPMTSRFTPLDWRAHLTQELDTPFEVVYGEGPQLKERIRYAWSAALSSWGVEIRESVARSVAAPRFAAFCDKCSDPLCERRLFNALSTPTQCN